MEDCVLDFDIDLFQQASKYDKEKVHHSMRVTKSKVISTNLLLKKFSEKQLMCKTLQSSLLTTKESYKQSCIDGIELREKCAVLEEEIKKLQEANKVIEEQYTTADNRYEGIQSHARQLQLLVKENETTIESLKIENQLEKSSFKDLEKKCAAMLKENNYLIKNIRGIRDIVFGKKTVTKDVKSFLNKYGKSDTGSECQEENSSDETDAFDDCMSPLLDPAVYNNILGSPAANKNKVGVKLQSTSINGEITNSRDDNDHDSQSSNEIVSSDTGRGSSLAFSDSDKCSLLSPEYFVDDSPLSVEAISNKDKMVVSIATSPILTREFHSVATSPIIFEVSEQMDIEDSELLMTESSHQKMKSNPRVPVIMIDRVVSPIFAPRYVDMSTNTDTHINCDIGTSPLKLDNRSSYFNYDSDNNTQEEECLDVNNINNLGDENSSDSEIRMIFDTMRFNQKLITPIPTTPAKSRSEAATNIATQTLLHPTGECSDAAKVKEDHMALRVTVAKLEQYIMNINNILLQSPSFKNEIAMSAQNMLQNNNLMEINKGMDLCNQHLEPKTALIQKNDELMDIGVTKNVFNFKNRILKMKELFDDSSPPSPSDGLHSLSANMLLCQPLSPPSQSLPPLSPPPMSSSPISPPPVSPTPASSPVSPPPVSPLPVSPSPVSRSLMSLPPVSPPPVSSPPVSPLPVSPSPVSRPLVSLPPVFPPPVSPPPVSSPPVSSLPVSPSPVSRPLVSLPPVFPPPVSPPHMALTPVSLPPMSPLSSLKDADVNMPDNNNAENNSFKSKEILHFEDPLLNEGSLLDEVLSDQEVHEIVVELGPDVLESDRESLHKILQEQMLQQQESNSEDVSSEIKKVGRTKKMTKLQKLRKNMVPKSKIKKTISQVGKPRRKLRVQPKRLTANKERIIDSVCTMDPKAAFEKARKVIADLKSKEKVSSNPVDVLDRIYKSPEKNTRKALESAELSSAPVEKEVGIHRPNQRDGVAVLEKLSPLLCHTEVHSKTRAVESVEDNRNNHILKATPESVATSKSATEDKVLSTPRFKRPVRTRSQSKCIDGNDNNEHNSEVAHFNTNHLTSPSLKRYGRNRVAHNSEMKCINDNNNTIPQGFVQDDIPVIVEEENVHNTEVVQSESRKRLKRPSIDRPDIVPKRFLRSSSSQHAQRDEEKHKSTPDLSTERVQSQTEVHKDIISYDDLDLFENADVNKQASPEQRIPNINRGSARHAGNQQYGILCRFIDKYGSNHIKKAPNIPENTTNAICKQLEDSIADIQNLPIKDTKQAMDNLVKDLQSRSPNHLLVGLIKYLKEPARKNESYNRMFTPPAPPMTKAEQILIYIVAQLNICWPDYNIMENILSYIEYTLFMLNRTPEFDVIETMSHFYAILCRYGKNKNRLRLFIIDAMYCLHFKAVPLIKQCLDVWMHILPLAHMGMAKNPLVTCLVYLLHFFKCEDRFNRVQDIRNILHRKYFYEVSEWNESGILEMFRNCIRELRDNTGEKKMLRMALIILAKRNGARWCQNHIIKNTLLPVIEEAGVPDRIKHFCVSLLGPLLKPYPMDMKVNCEVVMNQLFDMLKGNPTPQMEEAIYTSLVYMSRHNQYRVMKALLGWKPQHVSPEFEELLKNYVKERPIKSWRQVLSRMYIHDD